MTHKILFSNVTTLGSAEKEKKNPAEEGRIQGQTIAEWQKASDVNQKPVCEKKIKSNEGQNVLFFCYKKKSDF